MRRKHEAVLCGTIGPATILTVLFTSAVGCNDDSNNTAAFRSPPVVAVTTPLVAAITTTPVAAATDDAFRAAAGCPDCTVIARSTVTLPLTGKAIVQAKLISPAGPATYRIALDGGGNSVDTTSLLAAEGAAKISRQSKLRDSVYARSTMSSSELVPVSIWADVVGDHDPREQMRSDANFRATRLAQNASRLQTGTSKVTAWLDANGFATHTRGADTPLITAEVPASALADLGRLDGVAIVDLRYPEVLNGFNWFDAVKAPSAQYLVSSAAGIPFCNGEGDQPDSYTYLDLSGILDSSSHPTMHARWTSELISTTAGNSMAPGAAFYLPANDLGTDGYDRYQAWTWCFSDLGIWNMNRSAGSVPTGGSGASGLLLDDMALDYYAVNWPYPLITASAGNCVDGYGGGVDCITGSPVNGAYTDNRSYNTLIVGSSDGDGSPQTSDDFMSDFSQYINPVTTNNDFELPNLVAPGSDIYDYNIDSVSVEDAGTSASSAITMGAALLMETMDSSLTYYPEVEKALMMDASTHPLDGTRPEALGGGQDLRQGAGLLNSQNAIEYANPTYAIGPSATASALGHWAQYYDFSTDFPGGISAPYNIAATISGRLRAVIAWDATASGCSSADGNGCTGDVIDADLDLHILKYVSGSWQEACGSVTWDSSWELCDIPVNAGDLYEAVIVKNATNASGTYLGIAWSNYDPSSE